ncbi:DUF655 domain-containing protein [archaeon]|nr:DUF655 domain-containing protein [archaeon]
MTAEDYAIVLDFLPQGRSGGFKPTPLAQVIGTQFFTLLEVVPKQGISLKPFDKVYVGKEERKEVEFIKRRINFSELTNASQAELDKVIESIVLERKPDFIKFFNESRPISLKRHQLDLLPGIGQKHVQELLKARQEKPFESFEELGQRIPLMPNILKAVIKRIVDELDEIDRYYLFVRPPAQERFEGPEGRGYGRPFRRY